MKSSNVIKTANDAVKIIEKKINRKFGTLKWEVSGNIAVADLTENYLQSPLAMFFKKSALKVRVFESQDKDLATWDFSFEWTNPYGSNGREIGIVSLSDDGTWNCDLR